MKILVIGGHGTIGKKVVAKLQQESTVIIGGRSQGDCIVDIADAESIQHMFEQIGAVDAIVCIAGEARWGKFEALTEADFYLGIKSKLMGQINLVRIGRNYLNSYGSFTLTTGILADDPVEQTTSAALTKL